MRENKSAGCAFSIVGNKGMKHYPTIFKIHVVEDYLFGVSIQINYAIIYPEETANEFRGPHG